MVCAADPSRAFTPSRQTRAAACALAGVLALIASTGSASGQLIPTEKPPEIRGLDLVNRLGEQLPLDLELIDSNGKKITLGDKLGKGRPLVIAMIYLRCPLLCPQMQQRVIGSFNQITDFTIGLDYDAMFVSFDPRDGAAEAARAKADALIQYDRPATEQVRQGFSYVVGSAENTQKLADALGYSYRYLKESGEFSHGTALYVVTPEGVISRCFTKLEYDPKDLRLALVDASDGKIGTLLDLFTLWCYHPTDTGEYVIAPMNVMRIGAAISAVFVVGFVGGWAFRDYRRRQRRAAGTQPAAGPNLDAARSTHDRHRTAPPRGALGHSR